MSLVGCEDIDECDLGMHNCNLQTQNCSNTEGSFECVCLDGFKESYNIDSQGNQTLAACVDIEECKTNLDKCGDNTDCVELYGSYMCECHEGLCYLKFYNLTDKSLCEDH